MVGRADPRGARRARTPSQRRQAQIGRRRRTGRRAEATGPPAPLRAVAGSCAAGCAAGGCKAAWNHDARLLPLPVPRRVRPRQRDRSPQDRLRAGGRRSCPSSTAGSPSSSTRPTSTTRARRWPRPRGHDETAARAEAARRQDRRLRRPPRQVPPALDAGADPAVVAGWMAEVARPNAWPPSTSSGRRIAGTPLTKDQIRRLIGRAQRPSLRMLAEADPPPRPSCTPTSGSRSRLRPGSHDRERRGQPNACTNSACRRGDLNPHVLADTRPST